MLFRPGVGLASLTMILAVYFVVDGFCEITAAFKIRPDQGWSWLFFNGIIAVLLGFFIWRQWPVSGAWTVGVLVGIHILMTGWTMVMIGAGARRIVGVVEAAEDTIEGSLDKDEDQDLT